MTMTANLAMERNDNPIARLIFMTPTLLLFERDRHREREIERERSTPLNP